AFLDIVSILDTLYVVEPNRFTSRTLNLVVCVAMSCVITLDREIIKAYSRRQAADKDVPVILDNEPGFCSRDKLIPKRVLMENDIDPAYAIESESVSYTQMLCLIVNALDSSESHYTLRQAN
ncbi:8425_t:CDS:2, partial [Scutellospora calospora]